MALKVLFAASEVTPFAKTGGLADVAGSLPAVLRRLGHDVRVVMPYYRAVRAGRFEARKLPGSVSVRISEKIVEAEIYEGALPGGTPVYFIAQDQYYDRPELYRTKAGDYEDNAERFIFFSKAILDLPRGTGFMPDIFHCNDWQTGLAPLLMALAEDGSALASSRSVFTIHNMAYQGVFWHLDLHLTNLGWEVFHPEILEFYGKINLLKAGMVGADEINTVSRKYAQEIQTPEYGCGLEGVLQSRSADISGILNGADYDEWSPEKDKHIARRYSPQDLVGKKECRKDLLKHFHLQASEKRPVFGIISRLVDQKGFDLIGSVLDALLQSGAALVVLGSGEEKYQKLLKDAAKRFPERVGVHIGFDDALAHTIEAGSDVFLMPSHFEPCGLNQMYSMKYGTIPVVRATGGLDDTVENWDAVACKGNGFKFEPYRADALMGKIQDAMRVYHDEDQWTRLMRNAMACDFSWEKSAAEYEQLYRTALAKPRRRIYAAQAN